MRSTFGSFGSATSGLFAAQRAIDIVGHNLSNVNTKGYTRQRLNQTNARPMRIPGGKGPVGLGVEMVSITQIRNEFLDIQYRKESETLGFWEERETYLSQIESTFNEPSDKSIASTMNKFYASMHEVAKSAADPTARTVMIQSAVAFCENLSFMAGRFEKLIEDLNTEVESTVRKINTYAQQISTLNRQIYEVEIDGSHANDLRDRRNVALDELSKLVDIQVVNVPDLASDGKYTKMNVLIHGTGLVLHDYVNEIALEKNQEHPLTLDGKRANPPRDDLSTVRVTNLKWSTGSYIRQSELGGTLGGQLDMRDNFEGDQKGIPYYVRMLNEYAFEFAEKFNEIHSDKDARDLEDIEKIQKGEQLKEKRLEFFKPDGDPKTDALRTEAPDYPSNDNPNYRRITAKNIRVNSDILTHPSLLAAARVGSHNGGIDNNLNIVEILKIRENSLTMGDKGEKDRFELLIEYAKAPDKILEQGKIKTLMNKDEFKEIAPKVKEFFTALEALADNTDPTKDGSLRQTVLDKAKELAEEMNKQFTDPTEGFHKKIQEKNKELEDKIPEINTLLTEIAALNLGIYKDQIADPPVDASAKITERENKIKDFKGLLGDSVAIREVPDAGKPEVKKTEVLFNGAVLVTHDTPSVIEKMENQDHPLTKEGEQLNPKRSDLKGVKVTNLKLQTGEPIPMKLIGGTIGAIVKERDDFQDKNSIAYKVRILNEFANNFAGTFNTLQGRGLDKNDAIGKPLFISGSKGERIDASNIKFSEITADMLAVKGSDGGEKSNLEKMVDFFEDENFTLRLEYESNKKLLMEGKPDDVMKSLIGVLGIDAAEAQRKTKNQQMITESVDGYRKSVSGVSQDEEMSNMIKYQHAYNASARMITTIDEMIDVLINRMGRVGL